MPFSAALFFAASSAPSGRPARRCASASSTSSSNADVAVDDVLRELQRELGERDVDVAEALLAGRVELGAVAAKVGERLREVAAARRVEVLGLVGGVEIAERLVERLGEEDLAVECSHFRDDRGVGIAQLGRADHRLEMAREVRRVVELVGREIQRAERVRVRARRRRGGDGVERLLRRGEQRLDGGLDVLGADLVERYGDLHLEERVGRA